MSAAQILVWEIKLIFAAKDNLGLTALEGNRKRALWKKACRAIAKNVSTSPFLRSADMIVNPVDQISELMYRPASPPTSVPSTQPSPAISPPYSPLVRRGKTISGPVSSLVSNLVWSPDGAISAGFGRKKREIQVRQGKERRMRV